MNGQLIFLPAGMDLGEMTEVGQELIDSHARSVIGTLPQKTQIPAGNLDAVGQLAGDGLEAVFDELDRFFFEAGGISNALVNELDETGDDRERTVNVVDDA